MCLPLVAGAKWNGVAGAREGRLATAHDWQRKALTQLSIDHARTPAAINPKQPPAETIDRDFHKQMPPTTQQGYRDALRTFRQPDVGNETYFWSPF